MQRAALLHELLEPIPLKNMHANKKLIAIDDNPQGQGLMLKFEDETTAFVEALIGADGIFGSVRSHILGANHPAVKPVAAGWAGVVNLVPFAKAEEKLGSQWFEEHRQYGWVGPNGIIIHDLNSDGKMVQCIGTSVDHSPSNDRFKPVDRDFLDTVFADWHDGPIVKGMIDVRLLIPSLTRTHLTVRF
jgi:salicylate hydroxylase